MASELCMNCFSVKGRFDVCPYCGYVEGTPPKQPHYLAPGTILANHFIVGTAIGAGGFGITYKCYDTTLGVIVAAKEFYPVGLVNRASGQSQVGLLSGDKKEQYQQQIKRFLMEAQSIAQFGKAKDIVNVYDYFEENDTAYIIMEYIDGVLLKDYLAKQGKMPVDTAMLIVSPIIEAVKKIHAKGIVHRDISPDNIFISSEDSVKIFDFGAAQLNGSMEGMAGEKVIKVGYSAPEQYRDKSNQGFFTDIYSVGAIFYEMVTGIKPMESTERELKDELKSPAELGVKIEGNTDRAIMEALAVKPEFRFQGIQQLDDALNGKRLAEYPKVKERRRKNRRNWMIGLTVAAILAVGVGVGLFTTILKPQNPIIDEEIGQAEIDIWVDSQEQKEFLESFVESAFHRDAEAADNENTVRILQENKDITVNVMDVTAKDGGGAASMEEALDAAKGTEEFPEIFLTDHVEDLSKYQLMSYEDTVYDAISSNLSDYLFLPSYKDYFPDMKQMPTAFDAILFYALHARKEKSSSSFYGTEGDSIELEDIIEANEQGRERTDMDNNTAVHLTSFLNREGFDYTDGTFTFEGDFASMLQNLLQIRSQAESFSRKNGSYKIYGSSYLGGVGFRQKIYGMSAGNDIESEDAYQVYAPTVDGNMLIFFCNQYAISDEDNISENEQYASARFIWMLLGQDASGAKDATPLPIRKSGFETYISFNPAQECLQHLIDNQTPCVLVGQGIGEVWDFAQGVPDGEKGKAPSIEAIEDYIKSTKK